MIAHMILNVHIATKNRLKKTELIYPVFFNANIYIKK